MVMKENPIAFLDSGVGGISVLKEAVKYLPTENYIYYGDSANAPYGTKSKEEVRALTRKNVEMLMDMGAKAIVIACNTATSAAAAYLRSLYPSFIIIGVEPALKPAVLHHSGKRILVMATPMTLREEKFSCLLERYKNDAEIIQLPCKGLMEFVEAGSLDGEEVQKYLRDKLSPYLGSDLGAIVLGCTHYPFLKPVIRSLVGEHVNIDDGSRGTVRELRRRLEAANIRSSSGKGNVLFLNSSKDSGMIDLSHRLFRL